MAPPSPLFLRYLVVGGCGFLIDAAGMEGLVRLGAPVAGARLSSMCCAIAATYALHRAFTFSAAPRPPSTRRQFTLFALCQAAAAAANYGVFTGALAAMPAGAGMAGRMLALAAGTGAGLLLNFALLRTAVFPTHRQ